MEEKAYRELYIELEKYEQSGVYMKLGNYPASPMQIVAAHTVKEQSSYMRDYIWDEKGCIKELSFHPISTN